MKKQIILLFFIFTFSCSKSYHIEISERYNNGNKKHLDVFEVYGLEETLIKTNYYLSNGNLDKSIKFFNSKKISEWIQDTSIYRNKHYKTNYYTNGNIQSRGFEIEGVLFGAWQYYNRNGQLLAERYFEDNKESDIWIWYDSNMNIEHFQIKSELKNSGQLFEFRMNQSMFQKSTFKDGALNGPFESFFSDNSNKSKGMYARGRKNGVWEFFFKNNKIKVIESYNIGEKDGEFKAYLSNGKTRISGNYKNGNRSGIWNWYDNNDNINISKKY